MTFHLWSFLLTRRPCTASMIPRTRTNQRACCDFLQGPSSSAAGHLQSDKMKNSLKLKEQRATLVEELQAAVDLATSEDRDFTEAEETRQNEIHAEVKALDGKISKAEETEKIFSAMQRPRLQLAVAKELKEVRKSRSISKAMSDIINKGGA